MWSYLYPKNWITNSQHQNFLKLDCLCYHSTNNLSNIFLVNPQKFYENINYSKLLENQTIRLNSCCISHLCQYFRRKRILIYKTSTLYSSKKPVHRSALVSVSHDELSPFVAYKRYHELKLIRAKKKKEREKKRKKKFRGAEKKYWRMLRSQGSKYLLNRTVRYNKRRILQIQRLPVKLYGKSFTDEKILTFRRYSNPLMIAISSNLHKHIRCQYNKLYKACAEVVIIGSKKKDMYATLFDPNVVYMPQTPFRHPRPVESCSCLSSSHGDHALIILPIKSRSKACSTCVQTYINDDTAFKYISSPDYSNRNSEKGSEKSFSFTPVNYQRTSSRIPDLLDLCDLAKSVNKSISTLKGFYQLKPSSNPSSTSSSYFSSSSSSSSSSSIDCFKDFSRVHSRLFSKMSLSCASLSSINKSQFSLILKLLKNAKFYRDNLTDKNTQILVSYMHILVLNIIHKLSNIYKKCISRSCLKQPQSPCPPSLEKNLQSTENQQLNLRKCKNARYYFADSIDVLHSQYEALLDKLKYVATRALDSQYKSLLNKFEDVPRSLNVLPRSRYVRNIHDVYHIGPIVGCGGEGSIHLCIPAVVISNLRLSPLYIDWHTLTYTNPILKTTINLSFYVLAIKLLATVDHYAYIIYLVFLKTRGHQNVIKLHDYLYDEHHSYMIMEFTSSLNLFKFLEHRHLSEETCKIIFSQVLHGLSFLHSLNILHRDIKLENVLLKNNSLDSPKIVLIDFGNARHISAPIHITSCCVCRDFTIDFGTLKKIDLWAAGFLLYELLTGFTDHLTVAALESSDATPQSSNKSFRLHALSDYKTYIEKTIKSNRWKNLSESARDLISNLLSFKRNKTYTIEQALNHAWFAQTKSYSQQFN